MSSDDLLWGWFCMKKVILLENVFIRRRSVTAECCTSLLKSIKKPPKTWKTLKLHFGHTKILSCTNEFQGAVRILSCLCSPGLQGDVAVEHPAVVKLCLVSAWARVASLAALAGLAPCRHGLPLQADLSVGCRACTSAGVRRWGRWRQRAECELAAWTAGQLCKKTAWRDMVVK